MLSNSSFLRTIVLAALMITAALMVTLGAEPAQAQPAEAGQRSLGSSTELRLVVITDDDFLSPATGSWCDASLERARKAFQQQRPQSRLSIQRRHAGPPGILAGGRSPTGPRRALGLLCDASGAVAGFCVGVPTGPQLIEMADDAAEVAIWRLADELQDGRAPDGEHSRDALVEPLHDRARARVLRHYRPLLARIDRETTISAAVGHLLPALAADRAERFLIAGPEDSLRWLSAQQHVETMRHWCDAMLPSVIGQQPDAVWPELAAAVWDAHPWVLAAADSDVIQWYRQGIAANPVVLSINASMPLLGQPPQGDRRAAQQRGLLTGALPQHERLLQQTTHRQVGTPALARLMHHRQDKAVNLLGQAQAFQGWVVLRSDAPPQFIPVSAPGRLAETLSKMLDR